MRPKMLMRSAVALTWLLALLGLGGGTASADNNSTVTITDTGFNPPTLTISVGMTVFFTNTGSKVHTATTRQLGGVTPFDTGGISPNQTVSINFTMAGSFPYTSAVDCLNAGGGAGTGFDCSTTAMIVVNYGGGEPIVGSLTPLPTASPTPVLTGPPQNALVHITGKGFDPPTVTIALGGSVTFENDDNAGVHNAMAYGGGNPQPFDTGGLAPGITGSLTFALQGTYTYTSAVDCVSGKTPGFNCGTYQIVVSGQQSGLGVAPGATPVVATGQATVSIDDAVGFNPPALAVHPGQTVTWTNAGSQVHTVVSNPGYYSQFDSGGLAPGQKFSFTFQNAGAYAYHSTTETSYALDGMGNQVVSYKFNGTILVQ